MNTSARNVISKQEYYQLIGLRTLADYHNEQLENIKKSALNITQEVDGNGDPEDLGETWDFIYQTTSLDDMLSAINLKVEENE